MIGVILNRLGLRQRDVDSTPVFDGVLRPNQELDLCRLLGRGLGSPDDVVVAEDGVPLISVDKRVMALNGHWFAPQLESVATFSGRCGALAILGGGAFAVAVDGEGVVIRGGSSDGRRFNAVAGRALSCVTAAIADGDRLIVAEGSATNKAEAWRRDMFEGNRSGRVVEIDLVSGKSGVIASDLAWASGVAVAPDGGVVVADAWKHRVALLSSGQQKGAVALAYENIPAYPGRITAAQGGGYWLSCFAARTQLVDFVMADKKFARRMMRETDERYWIAPSLCATDHPFEPTQMGAIKQYGAKKPWAPPRSYGLVIRLAEDLSPSASLHSRVDGKRHGITGVATAASKLFVVSKGHGKVLVHEEVHA
jgi:hypothetical protein